MENLCKNENIKKSRNAEEIVHLTKELEKAQLDSKSYTETEVYRIFDVER